MEAGRNVTGCESLLGSLYTHRTFAHMPEGPIVLRFCNRKPRDGHDA
jgi:hypothetical protein